MSKEAAATTKALPRSQASGFAVGDAVVVPRHGLGTVVERGPRRLAGERREYLTIEVARGGMRLLIPTESTNGKRLRPLSSRRLAQEALSALASPPRELEENWRNRKNEVSARLASGKLVGLAALVRDLAHANRQKRLVGSDHHVYASALELLRSELQAVLEIDEGQAAREIDRQLDLKGLDATAKRGSD